MRLLVLVFILTSTLVLHATEFTYKGAFILIDNKIINAPLFVMQCDSFGVILIDYNNQHSTIEVKNIKKIIKNSNGKDIVILKDGRKFKVDVLGDGSYCFDSTRGYLTYKIIDPISGKLKGQTIYSGQIREIVFDADYGDVRIDSHNNIFPPDYIYSPYSGEKMNLIKLIDVPKE